MLRIERLVNLVAALLNSPRPLTADEIRTKVAGYDQPSQEAFRRAFERDKEDLRGMGIPLEVVPTDPFSDQADGYIIPKDKYYLPELHLEPDELAALQIAAQAVLGIRDQAETGLQKLSIDVEDAPWLGPPVLWSADLAVEEPLLPSLYSALVDKKPVQFDYEPPSSEVSTRVIDPYALVHRRGHWYVVGRDHARDAVRCFRVSRVHAPVRRLEGVFEVPASFDVDKQVPAEAWETGPDAPQSAVVHFDGEMRWWAEHNMADLPAQEAPGGGLEVRIPVANVGALISWVLGFDGRVEIVAPVEARRRLLEHLRPFLET